MGVNIIKRSEYIQQWIPRSTVMTGSVSTAALLMPAYVVYEPELTETVAPETISEEELTTEEMHWAKLYAEFAQEDKALAATGLAHYASALCEEEDDEAR
jgi:hypothetical protein